MSARYWFSLPISASSSNAQPDNCFQDLAHLQAEFKQVFEVCNSLSLKRSQDDRITIQPSAEPVSVKPYWYPYYQKAAIEKMVTELLQSGLIRPSNHPFSSLVQLIKKANRDWRFCVDYCALNTITIKDKYLIPMIDEVLDELHGTKFFSKLDLRTGYHQT